jgi:phosphoglycerate dehydrogenase-like enzyme
VRHRVLVLSRHAGEYGRLIEAARLPDLDVVSATDPAGLPTTAATCDIVFGEPSLVAKALRGLPAVRWVQATWAGVEPLLDPALRPLAGRDYILTNARGVFGALMSEYVFGYMLALERRMFERHDAQKEGRWDSRPPGTLRGKRLGLLGVGTIGAALARTGKHFGMAVKGYTRSSERSDAVDEYFHSDDRTGRHGRPCLKAFAADLDYLVSVVPDTVATRALVDEELLAALPPRAVFINPGRGSVVDEAALARALSSGRLAAAVLDVFQIEPLAADHVLWRTPNVLITAHTAALSAPADIAPLFVTNYRRFVTGRTLMYCVDVELGY